MYVDVEVIAKTRSSRSLIELEEDRVLKVHVKEPPAKGKANKAIIKLVSKTFGIPTSKVSIIRGSKSTTKIIRIEGIKKENFLKMLRDLPKDM